MTVFAATTPFELSDVDTASAPHIAALPVPPIAWGYCTVVDYDPAWSGGSAIITGAVYPESRYLEPTIGQIWPR